MKKRTVDTAHLTAVEMRRKKDKMLVFCKKAKTRKISKIDLN